MKRGIFFMAAIAALSLASCQNDPLEEVSVKKSATIFATTELPETRTTIGEDGHQIIWSASDKIAVYGADNLTAFEEYSLTDGEGTSNASFTGNEVSGDDVVAVYPSSFATEGKPVTVADGVYSIPVTIPATQTYEEGGFSDNSFLSVASGQGNVQFKNVMGLLKLQVYGTSARKISRIQIAAAEPLAGDAVVRYDGTGVPTLEFTGNTTKIIDINIESSVTLSTDSANPSVFYAVIPAGAFAQGFTVSLEQRSSTYSFFATSRTTKDNTIHRGMIKKMPTASVSFTVDSRELANTYIVNPGTSINIYPYRPDGRLVGHLKSMTLSQNIFSAVSSASAKGTVTGYTSYCKFVASANEGDVLLPASDADGVVWAWTVWITDTPSDVTLSNGSVIMDRNLGATASSPANVTASASETNGLRYQWGRKDPCFSVSVNSIASSATVGTVEYAISHPTAFILTTSDNPNGGDWLWNKDNTLWGETKTIYDPCPAGYKIPNGSGSAALWSACNFNTNADAFDSTNNGYYFNVTGDSANKLWFPFVAYYSGNDAKAYSSSYYWGYNSVPLTSGEYYGRIFKMTKTVVTNSSNTARSNAGSIRCEKIK